MTVPGESCPPLPRHHPPPGLRRVPVFQRPSRLASAPVPVHRALCIRACSLTPARRPQQLTHALWRPAALTAYSSPGLVTSERSGPPLPAPPSGSPRGQRARESCSTCPSPPSWTPHALRRHPEPSDPSARACDRLTLAGVGVPTQRPAAGPSVTRPLPRTNALISGQSVPCSCSAAADEMAGARFPASGTNGWDSRRLRAGAPRSVSGLGGVQPAAIDGASGGSSSLGERSRQPPWGERGLEGLLFSCLLRLEACCSLSGPAPGAMGLRRAREDLGTAPAGLWRGCAFGGFVGRRAGTGEGPRAVTLGVSCLRSGEPAGPWSTPVRPPLSRGVGGGRGHLLWGEPMLLGDQGSRRGSYIFGGLTGWSARSAGISRRNSPDPSPQPHPATRSPKVANWPLHRALAGWDTGLRGRGA